MTQQTAQLETKRCTKCGEIRHRSEFFKNSGARSGLQSWCKKCKNEGNKKRYEANPEFNKKRGERWRVANPEYGKLYYADNREHITEHRKKPEVKKAAKGRAKIRCERNIKVHDDNFYLIGGTKPCTKCGVTKDKSEYRKDRSKASGYETQCKECVIERTKQYREANPELVGK